MTPKSILVIGNQNLSRSIVSALVASTVEGRAAYQITVLTSHGQKPYLHPHVQTESIVHKTSDFTSASLENIFIGHDTVVSTIAGVDYELQEAFINAAVAAGVKKFIPHEFGNDMMNELVRRRVPGGTERAKTIHYLHQNQPVEWVAVAVGCILDTSLLTGNLGFDLEWQSCTICGSGDEVFPATSLERVGVVVERVIRFWSSVRNKYIYVPGVMVSGNELVRSLERSSDRKWSVGYSGVEDCVKEGEARVARGFLDSGMFLLERTVLVDESLRAAEPFRRQDASQKLFLEPETVDSIVVKTFRDFKHRGKLGCGCES